MLAKLATQHQAPCRTVPHASNGTRPQSRIGKKPIAVPSDVDVQVEQGTCLTVKVPAHRHLWLETIGCGAAAVDPCAHCIVLLKVVYTRVWKMNSKVPAAPGTSDRARAADLANTGLEQLIQHRSTS